MHLRSQDACSAAANIAHLRVALLSSLRNKAKRGVPFWFLVCWLFLFSSVSTAGPVAPLGYQAQSSPYLKSFTETPLDTCIGFHPPGAQIAYSAPDGRTATGYRWAGSNNFFQSLIGEPIYGCYYSDGKVFPINIIRVAYCYGAYPVLLSGQWTCGSCPDGYQEVNGACVLPCPTGTTASNGQCLPPSPNNGKPGCGEGAGNPIHTGTGNKFQEEADLAEVASLGLPFVRSYNSSNPVHVQEMGHGWSHIYARSVNLTPQGQSIGAIVTRADGRTYLFIQSGNTWKSDGTVSDKLVELKDGNGTRTGWRYTVATDDSVETYDAAGKLLTLADRSGRVQALAYDGAGCLASVADDLGRQLGFGYDGNNRIESVTAAAGVITYGYDSDNNLVSVTYPDGKSKTYHYNESAYTGGTNLPHALTGITDENGDRYATYQYQADGRAIATGHAGGADLNTLAYNADGSTTVTDPLGTQRSYNFTTILGVVKRSGLSQPGGSGCGASASETTYDGYGNVTSRTDFNGTKTCYVNDMTRDLEIARVEGLAAGSACPADVYNYTPQANTAERKIITAWHASFRLPAKITEPGRETTFAYDSYGNLTSRSVKDTVRSTTRTLTNTYTYHATVPGAVVKKIENGPRTDVSDLTTTDYYAPDENCLGGHYGCRGQVKQITNALGHVTPYDEYDASGHVTRITDPNGLVTAFTYTPRGWLQTRDIGGEVTRFDYDGVGQIVKLTHPDGSYVGFEYDAAHSLIAIVAQDGSRLTYTLDAAGNRIQEDITGPGGSPVHYTHRRSFDALGRLWQDIGALNQTVTYEYDAQGNMKQVDGARTDVADLTQHSYDVLDRLTQTLNSDGGVVQIKPNALDQTTQVVDPASQATTHTINALGDVLQTVSADTGTTVRTYDTAGNLKTERDARGFTVTYTYDALNRLTKKQSSQSGSPLYQYTYDTCAYGIGRLCGTLRNSLANIALGYDSQGRLASRLDSDGVNANTAYTYRPGGRIETLIYPSGRSVTYSYDTQGRVSQVTTEPASVAPVTVLADNFVYGYPFAGPQSFSYGNGADFSQTLDQDYRPAAAIDGPRNKVLAYDPAGNITSLADIDNSLLSFSYDSMDRLTGASDTVANSFGNLAWTYDPNGNRESETRNAGTEPYAYSPPNWLYQKGSDPRTKTASGNTASSTAIGSFTYDGFNRLATSVTAAETTTYTYNALGERMKKINQNGLSTVFHYGPNGELLWEKDANGNTRAYVWLDGRPLVRIDNDASIYYYHVDHLGTPQAMTNSMGAVVWKADYEPFGKATVKVNTVENNLRFPGQYYDRETGLHYNYFRDYDPSTGRYIESDPIGLDGGSNIYGYANQNPVTFTDPLGLTAEGVLPGFGAGAGVGVGVGETLAALGACARAVTLIGGAIFPSGISQCQDFPKPEGCGGDDECAKLIEQIQDVMRQLTRRYMHQCRNKKNQWEEHVPEFEHTKLHLSRLVAKAEAKNCPVPPKAYEWLQTSCPLPGTPRNSSPGY
ncbi:MAG: RHS repeat-associated core domain-containing protein [Thiobacillus sp.]